MMGSTFAHLVVGIRNGMSKANDEMATLSTIRKRKYRLQDAPAPRMDHRTGPPPKRYSDQPLECELLTYCHLRNWNVIQNRYGARFYIPAIKLGILIARDIVSIRTCKLECGLTSMAVPAVTAAKNPNIAIAAIEAHAHSLGIDTEISREKTKYRTGQRYARQ